MIIQDHLKAAGDALSIGGVLGTLAGLLPAIAAAFSIVWTLVRLYETRTCKEILHKFGLGPPPRNRRKSDRDA